MKLNLFKFLKHVFSFNLGVRYTFQQHLRVHIFKVGDKKILHQFEHINHVFF